jgi:hypothetical protein
VSIQASKSAMAHSEACAGIVGLLHNSLLAARRKSECIMHLRTPSTHCEGVLTSSGNGTAPNFALPRECGPAVHTMQAQTASGLNSFAYQVQSLYLAV